MNKKVSEGFSEGSWAPKRVFDEFEKMVKDIKILKLRVNAFRNGMVNIKAAKSSIGGLTPQDYANEILGKDDEIIVRTESDD
jgi:hypothetical protein